MTLGLDLVDCFAVQADVFAFFDVASDVFSTGVQLVSTTARAKTPFVVGQLQHPLALFLGPFGLTRHDRVPGRLPISVEMLVGFLWFPAVEVAE